MLIPHFQAYSKNWINFQMAWEAVKSGKFSIRKGEKFDGRVGGITDADSARVLNMHGTTTPGGLPWTVERVTNFRRTHRIRCGKRPSTAENLTMSEAATHHGISRNGLLGLERIGALTRNQVMEYAPWRVERKELDSERVQALVETLKTKGRLPKGGCPEGQLSLLDDE